MKIAGVVIWYNLSDADKLNIESYLSDIDKLYILDNSDQKNSYPENKKIQYIYNNGNLGIAECLNKAASLAISEGYDWLLTMDQDTTFKKGDVKKISAIIKKLDDPKVAIVSPWHNTKLRVEKPVKDIDYPLDVMTSGNFLNLKLYQTIGKFDELLFIDGVDMEYGLRINKMGYKIMRLNNFELNHNLGNLKYHQVFGKTLLTLNHNYIRDYYKVRNYRYIHKLYGKDFPEYCNMIIKLKQMIWCIVFYEEDKIRKLKAIRRGIKDFKKGKMGKYEV